MKNQSNLKAIKIQKRIEFALSAIRDIQGSHILSGLNIEEMYSNNNRIIIPVKSEPVGINTYPYTLHLSMINKIKSITKACEIQFSHIHGDFRLNLYFD
ncbi:MAG: hypothetical protein LBQ74_12985 [Prevotella sp.]|jgi:hypothetical protein|nr:hypothetical protein [Prevotella sp.]